METENNTTEEEEMVVMEEEEEDEEEVVVSDVDNELNPWTLQRRFSHLSAKVIAGLEALKALSVDIARSKDVLKEERVALEREKEEVARNRKQLEKELAFVNSHNYAIDKTVHFNVGGKIFQTTQHTLSKVPGSMLAAWFSGRHLVKRDENGHVFLDRSPALFEMILAYHRDGTVPTLDLQREKEMEAIAKEFEYFCLPSPWGQVTVLTEYERGNDVCLLQGHDKVVTAIDTDGSYVISGHSDARVRVWDCGSGQLLGCSEDHSMVVCSVKLHDGIAFSGSLDRTVKQWALVGGLFCTATLSHLGSVRGLGVDGDLLAAVGRAGSQRIVRVWRKVESEYVSAYDITLSNQFTHLTNFVCIIDGFIVTDHPGGLVLWNGTNGEMNRTIDVEGELSRIIPLSHTLLLVTRGEHGENVSECHIDNGNSTVTLCRSFTTNSIRVLGAVEGALIGVETVEETNAFVLMGLNTPGQLRLLPLAVPILCVAGSGSVLVAGGHGCVAVWRPSCRGVKRQRIE